MAKKNTLNVPPFIDAAYSSGLPEMRRLLAEGADVNSTYNKETALHVAVRKGNRKMLAFLAESGADLNALDSNELTPLMIACSDGAKRGSQIALDLIDAGADINYERKGDQMTALKFGAMRASPEVVETLIVAGAPVDGPARFEQTPLMLAARDGNVENMKILIAKGASLKRKCKLPWANGANALGLARMERKQKSIKYLEPLY